MRTASIKDFREHLAEMLDKDETVMLTRHGRPLGFYVPWKDTENLPLELKREAFLKNAPLRKKLFGHIDEKDLMEDFAKWQKEHRARHRH
jgi:antitoxin (DNA-binding transcriptional repressor) of toxin-antitoxin stability system